MEGRDLPTYVDWYGTDHWSDRHGYDVLYIILHDTEGSRQSAFNWWTSPYNTERSSAHDLIDDDGVVYRVVPYDKAAHHAGHGHIEGFNRKVNEYYEPNLNWASIGVELVYPASPASPEYPQVQLESAIEHVRWLAREFSVSRERVLGHKDVDPNRRSDPRNFPWEWFLDQVFAEVDKMLEQAACNAAWAAGGIPYNPEAAFPKYAREHGLGNPETPEFDFVYRGKRYRGQGFSEAIVYAEVGHWDQIGEVAW